MCWWGINVPYIYKITLINMAYTWNKLNYKMSYICKGRWVAEKELVSKKSIKSYKINKNYICKSFQERHSMVVTYKLYNINTLLMTKSKLLDKEYFGWIINILYPMSHTLKVGIEGLIESPVYLQIFLYFFAVYVFHNFPTLFMGEELSYWNTDGGRRNTIPRWYRKYFSQSLVPGWIYIEPCSVDKNF